MTIQVIQDGEKNFVLHLVDEALHIIDVSTLNPNTRFGVPTRLRLDEVKYSTDALINLSWVATVDDLFLQLEPGQDNFSWRRQGGLNNTQEAGFDGSVVIDTLATAYFMTLSFTKKYD